MGLFRLAALILFIGGGLRAEGWFVRPDALSAVGLIAFGLACLTASEVSLPQPPPAR